VLLTTESLVWFLMLYERTVLHTGALHNGMVVNVHGLHLQKLRKRGDIMTAKFQKAALELLEEHEVDLLFDLQQINATLDALAGSTEPHALRRIQKLQTQKTRHETLVLELDSLESLLTSDVTLAATCDRLVAALRMS
jgi:hypothetical protein